MINAQALWQFEPAAAGLLHDFILQPSAQVHRDRLAALWPGDPERMPDAAQGDAALSRALMRELGLDGQVDLDLNEPLHRATLLPPDGLARVAHQVELLLLAPRLRHVILRSELDALAAHVGPQDWETVLEHTTGMQTQGQLADALAALPLQSLLECLQLLGWHVLELAFAGLPPSVSRRALLKLPVVSPPAWAELSNTQAQALVIQSYEQAVQAWSPGWNEVWSVLPEHTSS